MIINLPKKAYLISITVANISQDGDETKRIYYDQQTTTTCI